MKKIIIVICFFFSCNDRFINNNSKYILDFDGNKYEEIKIGKQIWLKQNLCVKHYNDGTEIPIVKDSIIWSKSTSPMCCFYNNDTSLANLYGFLYNWKIASSVKNVCPLGWRVPSNDDWSILSSSCGGTINAGAELKIDTLWDISNTNNTNNSLFSALPSGDRDDDGTYQKIGRYAYYWTIDNYLGNACADGLSCAHECSLNYGTSYFLQDWGSKKRGMSIRCIKDTL